MYDYIKGALAFKNADTAVIENNGIGYKFLINSRTYSLLGEIGDEVKIYSKLIHKEDTMYLAGFKQKEDRAIFDILTSVSGIGTKVGMVLLDEFSGSELINAVLDGDYKLISRAKGVGPKLAQKIILELKGKLTNNDVVSNIMEDRVSGLSDSKTKLSKETIKEVQTILQSLGYSQNEYMSAIEHCAAILVEDSSEELLKETLKILSMG